MQKYQEIELVCKICAQKTKIDKLKEHSGLCRKIAEMNKELKDLENKMEDILSDSIMRSKETHTQLLVVKKEYHRLKKRRSFAKPLRKNSDSNQNPLLIQKPQKTLSTASSGSIEDNLLVPTIPLHGNLEILQGPKTARVLRDSPVEDESGIMLTRGRKLLSNGDKYAKRNSHNLESMPLFEGDVAVGSEEINFMEIEKENLRPEDIKKHFVERVLDKFPQKYEGSPSIERDYSGNETGKAKIQSLLYRKKLAGLMLNAKIDNPPIFYSDIPRTESGSEEEIISQTKKDDLLYSSEGSEVLKLSGDVSSSDKSLGNSPGISRGQNSTVYRKSQFFHFGVVLNADQNQEGEQEEPEKEEEEKKVVVIGEVDEQELKINRTQVSRGRFRRSTIATDRKDELDSVMADKLNRKLLQELGELKKKIEIKKNVNALYEVIKNKGKILLNEEAYHKSILF